MKGNLRRDYRLDCRAMGISNRAFDKENKKTYSVQFYDYDFPDFDNRLLDNNARSLLSELFPYDCIIYQTKHGLHFISFALLKGLRTTKSRALEVSKCLGNQDYWTVAKDLTLRVSPKWKVSRFLKKRKVISEKPKFKGVLTKCNHGYRISAGHLRFYRKYLDLPKWVVDLYDRCEMLEYEIRLYHYKTRD